MAGTYMLGLDAGTSLVKTVIFDLAGTELALGSRKVAVESPHPNWAQQDMVAVWEAAVATIRQAIGAAGIDPAEVAVVGLTGQGDGAWALDSDGNPVGPAALWSDGRANDIILRWEQDGILSEAFKLSGTVLWPGSQAAILAWMREHDPATFDRIDVVFCCKDWIKFKLTGAICTDETDGSIPFMSMASRQYSEAQMALLGFADFRDRLPPVKPASEVIGAVTPAAAEATGLRAGTPVVSGMLDVAANAIGMGVIEAGQSFTILGTTALNALIMDRPVFDPPDVGATVCHSVPGRWMRVLGSMAGTPNLDWYIGQAGAIFKAEADAQGRDVFTLLEQAVREAPVGSGGVIFHPYLQGERAPFLNPQARAGFFGISADTTRAHLARAVYEGVALSVRDCFEHIGSGLTQVMLAGGGANSRAWCQILADAVGCTMHVPAGTQFGALGAALAGAVGVGLFGSYQAAVEQCVKLDRTYLPDPSHVARYDALYTLYRDLVTRMEPFWAARQRMLDGWQE